jgi:hypothetical protein
MVKFLLQLWGVDYIQWLALTKASIRKDLRESSLATTLRHGRTGKKTFFTLVVFYFLTGLFFAFLVFTNSDIFFTATLLISYTMFMIAGLILVEYHTVVVSPDDYAVLSYRPINSVTYFFVRLSNIFFYILLFTSVMALPAGVAYMFTLGFKPILGVTALIAVYFANITVSLAIVILYSLILKQMSMERLQNFLAYFQLGLSFLIYGGYFFLPRLLESTNFVTLRLPTSSWFMLFPATWFSSYFKIALGTAALLDWIVSICSILIAGFLGYFALSKISLTYSESLAALAAMPSKKGVSKKRARGWFKFTTHGFEERVVSKLILSQFKHDNKFKMAVLGILPLTIFYLLLGVEKGPLPDPFETYEFNMGRVGILYFAILLFPLMLRAYVTQSDAYQASWIFYATPTKVDSLILAEKNFLMKFFVIPYLLILGIIFYYYFGNLWHVFLHLLVLGLLAHLFLQLAFLYKPELPFSRPNIKGSRSRNLILFLVLIPVVTYVILPLLFKIVYPNPIIFLIFILTFLAVTLLLENLVKARITSKMRKLEFAG